MPREDETPALLNESPWLVRVLSMIEAHGPAETLTLMGPDAASRGFHPVFVHDTLPAYQAELARLEAEESKKKG
ncbi:MAG: hypothetical protein AAF108_02940 [Planctomycetota bacterium]